MTSLIRAYSSGSKLSPHDASIVVGLGIVAIGALALWYRDDLYLVCQWVVRYRERSATYLAVQIIVPVAVIVLGIALILYPITG